MGVAEPQNTMSVSRPPQQEQEYVDYTCSTPLERLSRDIENTLRSWHVSRNDRHMSVFSSSTRDSGGADQRSSRYRSSSRKIPGSSSSRGAIQRSGGSSSAVETKGLPSSGLARVKPIRSVVLPWKEGGTLSLSLSLWDHTSSSSFSGRPNSHVPLSLQPRPLPSHSPSCVFGNIGDLFGIGQHLVLAPSSSSNRSAETVKNSPPQLDEWQMALNIAASNCECRIPAFALAEEYAPDRSVGVVRTLLAAPPLLELPAWLMSEEDRRLKASLSTKRSMMTKTSSSFFSSMQVQNQGGEAAHKYIRPLFSGYCNPGSDLVVAGGGLAVPVGATFCVQHVGCLPKHLRTVLDLERVCRGSTEQGAPGAFVRMAVYGYEWSKQQNTKSDNWRRTLVEDYCRRDCDKCAEHSMELIRAAWAHGRSRFSAREPLWGPSTEPLSSLQAKVSWAIPSSSNIPSSLQTNPRSYEDTSPASFKVQCYWDRSVPCHTLSASIRCVVAATVRASTLHKDFLLCQLSNQAVLDELDPVAMEAAATRMSTGLGKVTCRLVQAMDFLDYVLPDTDELESRVNAVLEGKRFPSPSSTKSESMPDLAGAPPGRLLSVLSLHMCQMKTPARMAALWLTFVEELRMRWEKREFLPHLHPIPGFDDAPVNVTLADDTASNSTKYSNGSSTINISNKTKANLSAYNNCSEPDPHLRYCLLNQKLQVFNIGVECTIAAERVMVVHKEKQKQANEKLKLAREKGLKLKHITDDDEDDDTPIPSAIASTTTLSEIQMHQHDILMEVDDEDTDEGEESDDESSGASGSSHDDSSHDDDSESLQDSIGQCRSGDGGSSDEDEFFDSVDVSGSPQGNASSDDPTTLHMSLDKRFEESTGVVQRQGRRGARCPVSQCNLIASGDQLFAPYLQRPMPLTEDVMTQRKLMLHRQGASMQAKIQVAHRVKKPVLLSDMSAFKAANPGAIFQDFINWYGNPGSPFEGMEDVSDSSDDDDMFTCYTARTSRTMRTTRTTRTMASSVRKRGPEARRDVDDAIEVLTATRTLWSDTWDEAAPVPASEQQPPLFDPMMEVEMVLNLFETLHPCHLLNQVLASSMTTAVFMLRATAGDAIRVKTVGFALSRLEDSVESALSRLKSCLHSSLFGDKTSSSNEELISRDALQACDTVCNEIGNVEVLLSRATSLLHKFPGEHELVQKLLRKRDGEEVSVSSSNGRAGLLRTIHAYRGSKSSPSASMYPEPDVEEYVLRTEDASCQLAAVLQRPNDSAGNKKGSLLLALRKCRHDL